MKFMNCAALLVVSIIALKPVISKEYYIVPSSEYGSFSGSGFVLSEFASHLSNTTESNITVYFVSGNHYLEKNITVSNVLKFSMLSLQNETSVSEGVIITCRNDAQFSLSNVTWASYSGVTFVGCSNNRIDSVNEITIKGTNFQGHENSTTSLLIVNSIVNMTEVVFESNGMNTNEPQGSARSEQGTSELAGASTVGGAIFVTLSDLTLDKCQFTDNVARTGGAIFSEHTDVTIINSTFMSNNAHRDGAVMACNGGNINVTDSDFSNNTAGDDGGVAYIYNNCILTMDNCRFQHNEATDVGGVIFAKESSIVNINNCVATNCRAGDYGGVILVQESCIAHIESTRFKSNSADYGGVVVARRISLVAVHNCSFIGNMADIDGSTLYARISSNLTITNSSFVSNKAENNGIVLVADHSRAALNNVTFDNNSVGFSGGAVWVYDNSSLEMSYCEISNSLAGDSGGGIYGRKQSYIIISNCTATNNMAENSGGVVYAQENSTVIIDKSLFEDNTADYGGVLRVYIESNASVSGCIFLRNKGELSGGTLAAYKNSNMMIDTSNFSSNIANFGSAAVAYNGYVAFEDCAFHVNYAQLGGVFRALTVNVTFLRCKFHNNNASSGGVLYIQQGNIDIDSCTFENNHAINDGGVLHTSDVEMIITNSTFNANGAQKDAGVLYTYNATVIVSNSTFCDNSADLDGGVYALSGSSRISVFGSNLSSNSAMQGSGVMALMGSTESTVHNCCFSNNKAKHTGGVFTLLQSNMTAISSDFSDSSSNTSGGVAFLNSGSFNASDCTFTSNSAANSGGGIHAEASSKLHITYSRFDDNHGTASGGAIYISGDSSGSIAETVFENCTAGLTGGALLLSECSVTIGSSNFHNNTAPSGAAIAAMQNSELSISSTKVCNTFTHACQNITTFYDNVARKDGSIYLSDSKLHFGEETDIRNNNAGRYGGGIHSVMSSITVNSRVIFYGNNAKRGGGAISYSKSKLYDLFDSESVMQMEFTSNEAEHGGAMYVHDEMDDMTCMSDPNSGIHHGCFFENVTTRLAISFINNTATSGKDLYGGLLDRCSVSGPRSSQSEPEGIARFEKITHINATDSVSSKPVQVCICSDGKLNCSQRNHTIDIKKGSLNEFSIELAAIDQVNHIVSATILSTSTDELVTQVARENSSKCSTVTFKKNFPDAPKTYNFDLYAEGPCKNKGISTIKVSVKVEECLCPAGFMTDEKSINCRCMCDQKLQEKIINDDLECRETEGAIVRKGDYYVSILNKSEIPYEYFKHSHCPLDYCLPPNEPVQINLGDPNGEDAQCANNRAGLLCGNCRTNYSLSLAGSKCVKCPENWPVQFACIIFSALVAGVLLVLLILVLNLTVAVGTLNSIIFFANIINANKSVYFGQLYPAIMPMLAFISWLNLDVGLDLPGVCFFEGMDTYAKTWLQLAFPSYIIFIVILIIGVSSCSSKFANLIGKKNPVATLATLILLSYTKLLQTSISSLAYVSLSFPNSNNGTTETRWLPDPTIEYDAWKHIVLVVLAVFILILGLMYTAVIFSWQWLLDGPNYKILIWTRNQKLHSFIDAHHSPYTPKHRYWTGLLLLVRVMIYLISAFSASTDPQIILLSTIIIMCSLYLYKTVFMIRVYKNRLLSAMESLAYFNIALFAAFKSYTFDNANVPGDAMKILHTFVVYTCVGLTLLVTILVILYHMYRYGSAKVYNHVKGTKLVRGIRSRMSTMDEDLQNEFWSKPRDTYALFKVIDDPRQNTYNHPPALNHLSASSSIISMENCEDTEDTKALISDSKDNPERIRKKSRAESQPFNKRSFIKRISLLRKTEPKVLKPINERLLVEENVSNM